MQEINSANQSSKKVSRFLKNIIFSAIAFILVLVSAEGIARLFPPVGIELVFSNPHRDQPDRFIRDPLLFWRLNPNDARHDVNAQGFRGTPPDKGSQSYQYLIAYLGDSSTFGVGGKDGVPVDETYPALSEKMLRDRISPDIRALNLGVPGYTSFQGLLYLKEILKRFSPDLVVFAFGTNDSLPADKSDDEQLLMPNLAVKAEWIRDIFLQSNLARYIIVSVKKVRKGPQSAMRIPPEKFAWITSEAKSLALKAGIPIFFIAPTCLNEKGEVVRDERYLADPLIDPTSAFRDLAASGDPPIFQDDKVHPTPAGHRALAQILTERLTPVVSKAIKK